MPLTACWACDADCPALLQALAMRTRRRERHTIATKGTGGSSCLAQGWGRETRVPSASGYIGKQESYKLAVEPLLPLIALAVPTTAHPHSHED